MGVFMTVGASVWVGLSSYRRNKTHHLVDLLPLIFFFSRHKQVVAMSNFLNDIGSCVHLIFVVGLDWAFTLT